jgi:hypothetical protein
VFGNKLRYLWCDHANVGFGEVIALAMSRVSLSELADFVQHSPIFIQKLSMSISVFWVCQHKVREKIEAVFSGEFIDLIEVC